MRALVSLRPRVPEKGSPALVIFEKSDGGMITNSVISTPCLFPSAPCCGLRAGQIAGTKCLRFN